MTTPPTAGTLMVTRHDALRAISDVNAVRTNREHAAAGRRLCDSAVPWPAVPGADDNHVSVRADDLALAMVAHDHSVGEWAVRLRAVLAARTTTGGNDPQSRESEFTDGR